jgi:hypothetical protein
VGGDGGLEKLRKYLISLKRNKFNMRKHQIKYTLIFLFVMFNQLLFAQHDSIGLNLIFVSGQIKDEKSFEIGIKFTNHTAKNILVLQHPIITDYTSRFGDIKFKCEKLDSACYSPILVHHDFFGMEFSRSLRAIDSVFLLSFDISTLYDSYNGNYRIKMQFYYYEGNIRYMKETDWYYYEVVDRPNPRRLLYKTKQ